MVARLDGLPSSLRKTPASETDFFVESEFTATPEALAVQHTRICPLGLVERCIQGRAQKVLVGNCLSISFTFIKISYVQFIHYVL